MQMLNAILTKSGSTLLIKAIYQIDICIIEIHIYLNYDYHMLI